MTSSRNSSISNNSTASGRRLDDDDPLLTIQQFAKHMLKNSVFIGTFQEKRFVEPLLAYKDVIRIDAAETDFIENLMAVKKRIVNGLSASRPWLGVTEPTTIGAPTGYNLWVDLRCEVFGSYWFTVRDVEFRAEEICLRLRIVRPARQEEEAVSSAADVPADSHLYDGGVRHHQQSMVDAVRDAIQAQFTQLITVDNARNTFIFVGVLVAAMVTGGLQIIQYLMEYFLKLIPLLSQLLTTLTPVILGGFKVIANIFNGLFLLIAMLWTGERRQYNYKSNGFVNNGQYQRGLGGRFRPYRALPSPYKSSVVITPLD